MKRLICAIILSGMAYGQGVRFESVATTTVAIGNYPNVQTVLPGATVTVYQYGTTVAATLCTDITCATPALTNIVTADLVGNFGFFAMPGNYSYQVSGTGAVTNMFSVTLGGGLIDPGSNGIVYRSGLNTTRDANFSDIVALWTACTGFLGYNGTCGTGGTGGGGDVTTTPTTSQEIIQPTGTNFCANVVGGIVYVCPSWNWLQAPSGSLTGGIEATVTLDPAPLGIDTTNNAAYGGYGIYVAGTGTAEAVAVTGGTCTNAGTVSPCTVIFTPVNNHDAGFTLGSASGGIQEAINYSQTIGVNNQVVVPPLPGGYDIGYNIYWPITVRFARGSLTANFASLNCYTRSTCMQLGSLTGGVYVGPITVSGFRFRPHVVDGGCLITQTSRVDGVDTVTYTGDCTYKVGDLIRIDYTDNPDYWGDHVLSAASAGSVSWLQGTGGVDAQNTPGTIALANDMILDNAAKATIDNMDVLEYPTTLCPSNPDGTGRCKFGAFFDFWDDESAVISHFTTDGYSPQCWKTYCGSVVYSGGRMGGSYCTGGVCASVIDITHSSITSSSNGVTVYNSNGVQISDTIIQGTCMWDLSVNNIKGNYLGATLKDVYNESSGCSGALEYTFGPFM